MSLYYQNVDMTSESEDPQPARGGLPQIPRGRHDQPRHGGGRGHRDSYCLRSRPVTPDVVRQSVSQSVSSNVERKILVTE